MCSSLRKQSNKTGRQNGTSLLPGDRAKQSRPHGGHGFYTNPIKPATSSALSSEEMKWGKFTLLVFTYRVSERSLCIIHMDGSLTETACNDMHTYSLWDLQTWLSLALNCSEREIQSQQVRKHNFFSKYNISVLMLLYACHFEYSLDISSENYYCTVHLLIIKAVACFVFNAFVLLFIARLQT